MADIRVFFLYGLTYTRFLFLILADFALAFGVMCAPYVVFGTMYMLGVSLSSSILLQAICQFLLFLILCPIIWSATVNDNGIPNILGVKIPHQGHVPDGI